MSKIKNSGLHQYGAEAFEQQQCGTASAKGVKVNFSLDLRICVTLSGFGVVSVKLMAVAFLM